MRRFLLAALVAFLVGMASAASSADETPSTLFPFVLPADDVTAGITDLSFLNDRPADQPVSVRDGHFYAGGKRIRFWGFCVIGAAAFPSHDEATLIARRLVSRGVNQVRIHLIDGYYAPTGLFDPDHKGQLRILPSQFDRLDFFIAELKKRGIYVELPVHGYHWRNVSGETYYPGADLRTLSAFGSGIPFWNERYVEAEKQFARDFFCHVNPYTGKAYTDEPCVSTVEILNENGVLCAWRRDQLRKSWPPAMVGELQMHWNRFLKKRYTTTDQLRQAWAAGEVRADPRNLLTNGDFSAGAESWGLQAMKPSTARMEVVPAGGPEASACVVVSSDRSPQKPGLVDFYQTHLSIEKGCRYQLTFAAKAEQPANVCFVVSLNRPPWNSIGLSRTVEVGTAWKETTLTFMATQDEAAAKIMVTLPVGVSRVSMMRFSLRKADVVGLPPGESLEAGVAMPPSPEERATRTRPVIADCVDFLYELDSRYFDTLREFLRKDLGCKHPIKGTQVDSYSSYFSQARFDYIDSHGYWEHPRFPRKPWDPKDWTIGNSPMINAGGQTAVGLAERRVCGMPFNVSEYCHPAPSTYCAEQVPTIASLGALQDWDGVVFHCWQEMAYDWRRREMQPLPADRIDRWFNTARHPVKLVTLPFGALAFRRGDVAPAHEQIAIGTTLDEEKRWFVDESGLSWRSFEIAAMRGIIWRDVFTHRVCLALGKETAVSPLSPEVVQVRSDNGEMSYDLSDPAAGVLTVDAPRAKAVIGFGAGKTFVLGDVTIQPGPTMQNGFSVLTASAVHGDDFHSPGAKILVTATGYVENRGAVWNDDKSSVGDQWGDGPVMCEGIPFTLALKTGHASAWALDSRGNRMAPVATEQVAEGIRFAFGPRYKTLWYEIVVAPRNDPPPEQGGRVGAGSVIFRSASRPAGRQHSREGALPTPSAGQGRSLGVTDSAALARPLRDRQA